jgi:hypothetical protein
LVGHCMIFDGKYMEWRKLKLPKTENCPICAGA